MTAILLRLLPLDYWRIIGVATIFLAGLFAGYKATSMWYKGEISDLNMEVLQQENVIKSYTSSYNTLVLQVDKQNKSIAEYKEIADKKQQEVEIAQNKARITSKAFYSQANTLQRKTINKSTDACLEASKLIDEELQKERLK